MYRILRKIKNKLLEINWIHNYYGFYGLYRFITNQPNGNQNVHKMYLLTHYNQNYRTNLEKEIMSYENTKAVVMNRLITNINLEKFESLPKLTLGHQYFLFIKKNKITPLSFSPRHYIQADIYTYIILRMLETHDIYHTLLNEDTDLMGEGLVASFTITQLPTYVPPAVHIGAGFIYNSIKLKANLCDSIHAISKGHDLGKSAKQLFAVDWNDYWETDINELRKQLNINLNKESTTIN